MEPPTPTQKPRPISSRLANSPADRSTPGSTSSTMRNISQNRPGSAFSTPDTTIVTPSSGVSERLEDLLAQFELEKANGGIDFSPLRPMSTNITAPSPLRLATTSTDSIKTTTSTSKFSSDAAYTSASTSSSTIMGHNARSISSMSSAATTTAARPQPPRSQYSPTKRNAPRIGLRSSQAAPSAPSAPAKRPECNKAFKPPLLVSHRQPTRSSPRRHVSAQDTAQTPVRATATSSRDRYRETPTRRRVEKEDEVMEDAPSSDGPTTGDESFDSFDGIFAEGGADVDQLLKTLDGA